MKVEFPEIYLEFFESANRAFNKDIKLKIDSIKKIELALLKSGKGSSLQSKFNFNVLNALQNRLTV